MRYLVKARVKPGKDEALLRAIEDGRLRRGRRVSLGYATIARNARRHRALGGGLLLPDSARGRATVLGGILQFDQRQRCARKSELP